MRVNVEKLKSVNEAKKFEKPKGKLTPVQHHGLSQTAGRFCDAGPKVCETTKPLAWDV